MFARVAFLALLLAEAFAYGQPGVHKSKQQLTMASIPFVRCPTFGQVETYDAPTGTSQSVPLSKEDAQSLAYYKSADGISVLAPRGWYCQGASGSGGASLYLGPEPITYTPSSWKGLDGAAIEVNHINGENSGRYDIATVIARVFPAYRWFGREVWAFDTPLPASPFPKDRLVYRSNAVVEYRTPPHTEGLGNFESYLGKNGLAISGTAILLIGAPRAVNNVPHVILLSVRVGPDLEHLTPTIIQYAERERGSLIGLAEHR